MTFNVEKLLLCVLNIKKREVWWGGSYRIPADDTNSDQHPSTDAFFTTTRTNEKLLVIHEDHSNLF